MYYRAYKNLKGDSQELADEWARFKNDMLHTESKYPLHAVNAYLPKKIRKILDGYVYACNPDYL